MRPTLPIFVALALLPFGSRFIAAQTSPPPPIMIENEVVEIEVRKFKIPFALSPFEKTSVSNVRLFVSSDLGKSWRKVEDRDPSKENYFAFETKQDGLLWFAVQSIESDGKANPDEKSLNASLKVYVNANKRTIVRKAAQPIGK